MLSSLIMAISATATLVIRIVLLVLMIVSAVFLIITVLKQQGNSDGLSAIQAPVENDTFYNRNSAKNKEKRLKIWTLIAVALLAVCSIVFFIMAL